MIFVTVGTQLGFDRLVRAVDEWAARNPGAHLFGQIGSGRYRPLHFESRPWLTPGESDRAFSDAELIVAHAGMGSILTALRFRKPIIIVPRSAASGEHRNDHQLATATRLEGRPGIFPLSDTRLLGVTLDRRSLLPAGEALGEFADESVLARLRDYLREQRFAEGSLRPPYLE